MNRTISTKLVIEGEDQYKQAVKSCNGELAVMKSELAKVQSAYEGNANSIKALTAKDETLNAMQEKQAQKVAATASALQNAQSVQKSYATQVETCSAKLSSAEAQMEKLKSSTADTSQEQKGLAKEIESLKKELSEAEAKEQAATKSVSNWQKQNNYAERDLNKLNTEVEKNKSYLDEAKASVNKTATSIDRYGKEVKKASDESKEFGEGTEAAFSTMAAALAASGVVAGIREIGEALKECVDGAKEFESGMAEVFTLLPGESKKTYKQMSGDMVKFSNDMNVMTSQSVPALYQAISSGVPKDNVYDFLATAQKAAVGGVSELETAVDGLTSITNAYGKGVISATQTSDMMFTAVRLGKTDFKQLSSSIYNVVPTAAAAKIGFDNVAAALAVITAQGVPTSVATTQLRQMFVELTDSGSNVGKVFSQIAGQSFKQFIASGGNVQQALEKLEVYAKGTGLGVNELFSSVQAGNSALQLTGSATESFSQALSEMKDSAGATDAAYETMTQTAAYSMQQVAVSFDNFKASVGDALLPALANLSDAATPALQWAGDFIEENPWLIQAITAVTVGIVGFATSVTMATTVMKIFEFVMSADPIIKVGSAIASVVAALVIFTAGAKGGTKSVQDLTKASTDAKKSLKEISDTTANTVASTQATADVAAKYTKRLKELEAQGLNTDAAQREYKDLVQQLNALIPDLNLQIDAQTGLIKGGTAALEDNTKAWQDNATEKAFQDEYNDLLKKQADVTVEITKNQTDLNATEAEMAELQAKRAELTQRMEDRSNSLNAVQRTYDGTLLDLKQSMHELDIQMSDNQGKQNTLNEAIAKGQDVADGYNKKIDESRNAHKAYKDGISGVDASLSGLNAACENAQTEYGKLAKAAQESIEKQIGQWEKMDNKAKTSVADLNAALQSQITYLANYSKNLESLAGRNVAGVDTLVEKLSDGSKESASILAGLATATDAQIKEVVKNMGKVEEGKQKVSEAVAAANQDFKAAIEEMIRESDKYQEMYENGEKLTQGMVDGARKRRIDLLNTFNDLFSVMPKEAKSAMDLAVKETDRSKEMYKNGQNSVQGMVDGAEQKKKDLIATYASIANASISIVKSILQIHSPSKVFGDIGNNTIDGMVQGIKDREDDLSDVMKEAVDLAIQSFGDKNEEAKEMAGKFLDAYNQALSDASAETERVANELKGKLNEITDEMKRVQSEQEGMEQKLQGYGELFTIDPQTHEMTLNDIDEQDKAVLKFGDTLGKLKDINISDSLLDKITSMDVDTANSYGDKLLEMYDISPEKWEEYNAKWNQKQEDAKSIAKQFYQDQLDALKNDYNNELETGLEVLKTTSFQSGINTVESLMAGMQSKTGELYAQAQTIANNIRDTINSALNSSSTSKKKKSGSHAGGLNYVPFDGYVAELHKGERVLTASEARAYIDASIPRSFEMPSPKRAAERQTAAMVNAISTLTTGLDRGQAQGDMTITLKVNGTDFARATIDNFRSVSDQSPRVESDFV